MSISLLEVNDKANTIYYLPDNSQKERKKLSSCTERFGLRAHEAHAFSCAFRAKVSHQRFGLHALQRATSTGIKINCSLTVSFCPLNDFTR